MRRTIVTSLLALFLISGTGFAYADHHRGGNDKDRKEWKHDKKRPGGKKDKHDGKKNKHRYRKDNRHDSRHHGGPGFGFTPPRPTPPPPPPPPRHHVPRHYNHAYYYPGGYSVHENLGYMISRVVGGGRDFNVWQVDEGTYVVRFRKGRKLYTQYLYPYEGRYGKRSSVSLNWAPQSPWSLIPSIHLNFNL